MFDRRHHCRCCGNLFCGAHSTYIVPLDQDARFHIDGFESRACSYCYSDFKEWELDRNSRNNSTAQDAFNNPSSAITIGTPQGQARGQDVSRANQAGESPSRDYIWSTF